MMRSRKNISNKTDKFFSKLIKWLANNLTMSSCMELTMCLRVTDKIFTILNTRGKTQAIKYCKDLRLVFINHIFDMDDEFNPGCTTNIPKILRPIIRHIKKKPNYPFIRLVNSCLYITRFIRLEPTPNHLSIEERPGYTGDPQDLSGEMLLFLKELGVNTKESLGKIPKSLRFKDFHMTSKSGPNGHALWTSFDDYISLPPELLSSIKVVGGERLHDLGYRFNQLYLKIRHFFDGFRTLTGTRIPRRLACIQDKEGKTREVAILDYYSQAALLPLHNFLFKQLNRIDQDCTFNQTKKFSHLKPDLGSSFHSIDLTTATDRFPIMIQYEFLKVWFGSQYADAWKTIMVGYPFTFKGKDIYYNTGNPMGAYSSWGIFAICHHFLVWKACKRAKRNWKRCPYMMLGDDIVIANDTVAYHYKEILKEWDIPISHGKSHVSKYGFEFAKQIRLHKQNVSPFPLSALFERRSETFTCLSILVSEAYYKGWKADIGTIVKTYYMEVLGWARPRFSHAEPKISLVISLLMFLKGQKDLGIAIKEYVALWTGKNYEMSNTDYSLYGNYLALLTLHDTFLRSKERIVKGNQPLGDLATEMVIHITSLHSEQEQATCFNLIEAVPFLQIYGRAEETFLNLNSDISVFMIGENPTMFRDMFGKVDIPLSDTAFYQRHRDVIINQCLKASDIIISYIKSVPEMKIPELDIDIVFPWSSKITKPRVPMFNKP